MSSWKSAVAGRFYAAALIVAACLFAMAPAASAQTPSTCGPMDVTFVIDNTGSMADVNAEVLAQVGLIADAVVAASGNDYQFGLVALPRNDVAVLLDMTPGNRGALAEAAEELVNAGSCGLPASWDEGLNTVLNNLGPREGPNGVQIGTFAGIWRDDAAKIIILITDTDPSGFDCEFEKGVNDVRAMNMAAQAVGRDIAITSIFVPTGGGSDPDVVRPLMQQVAGATGGLYKETEPDASDLATVIVDVLEVCGQGSALRVSPLEVAVRTGETFDVAVTNYRPGDTATLFYTSTGLPSTSAVTFTRQDPKLPGTDLQQMRITVGQDTAPGTYFVYAQARHTDRTRIDSNYVMVVVDCKPPGILGTAQPVTQTVAAGGKATFTVGAVGSPRFTYQWYEGFTGNTRNPIQGATGPTFTTPAVNDMKAYWVRVTNVCGSADSVTAYALPQ